jgi:catechol 2,3-dioxygenase-like lactoylglutathione lyase family enzyme
MRIETSGIVLTNGKIFLCGLVPLSLPHNSKKDFPAMNIDRIDHFVLTVADIEATCAFYTRVLGMTVVHFGTPQKPRVALAFGGQKINLHQVDNIPDPNVLKPTPGSADFCLTTQTPLDDIIAALAELNVQIIEGPVARTGARAAIRSIYIRDPDLNLVEIANEIGLS